MTVPVLALEFHDPGTYVRELASGLLVDFEVVAVHEESETAWRVFFRSHEERERAARVLDRVARVTPLDVASEDWARRSQESLGAVAVGGLIVAPPWDVPRGRVIVIEPSTGFGTGHHATTRLCLRALQRLDLRGKDVLDVGTGSGILAIAAAKLGARRVTGVDHDPDALAAASANVARNNVAVRLRLADATHEPLEAADVVLANLTGTVLLREAARLAALAAGGTLIVSGALDEEIGALQRAFAPHVTAVTREDEEGWGALTLSVRSRTLPAES